MNKKIIIFIKKFKKNFLRWRRLAVFSEFETDVKIRRQELVLFHKIPQNYSPVIRLGGDRKILFIFLPIMKKKIII